MFILIIILKHACDGVYLIYKSNIDAEIYVINDSDSEEAGVVGEAPAGPDRMLDIRMSWCTCGLCSSTTLGS